MRLKLHDEIAIRCLVTIIISVLNQFFLVKNGMTCSDYGQTKAQFGAGANLLLARTAGCEIYSTLEVLPALLAVIVKYASSCELPGVAVMTCFAWFPSLPEMIVILIVGVLLFGRRLPEVGPKCLPPLDGLHGRSERLGGRLGGAEQPRGGPW